MKTRLIVVCVSVMLISTGGSWAADVVEALLAHPRRGWSFAGARVRRIELPDSAGNAPRWFSAVPRGSVAAAFTTAS